MIQKVVEDKIIGDGKNNIKTHRNILVNINLVVMLYRINKIDVKTILWL